MKIKLLNKLRKTKLGKIVLGLVFFIAFLLILLVLFFILLFLGLIGTMVGILNLDQEADTLDINLEIPEEYMDLYIEVQNEFNVPWLLIASIHAIQTEFAEKATEDGFFGWFKKKKKFNDAFDLPDYFWNDYQESKERYWCIKNCEEQYDRCSDGCSRIEGDASGCYRGCDNAYRSCYNTCMLILPDRDKFEDIVYTVAMFLERIDMQDSRELHRKIFEVTNSHEKTERVKLFYWLYQRHYGGGEGWPLPPEYTYISSPFGWRIHPIDKEKRFHSGIDIPAPFGTPIYAFRDGTVTFADWTNNSYGTLIIIDHGDGLESRYAHMQAILVSAGETVEAGQQIAEVGSEGGSTGAHLHFEVRVDGEPVDPMLYLSQPDKDKDEDDD